MRTRRPRATPRPTPTEAAAGERVQKRLARAGLASRRAAEEWIRAGRVRVDGTTVGLGARVLPGQRLRVDGRLVEGGRQRRIARVLRYHKRTGELCTRAEENYPTVFASLPALRHGRWVAIGRLDLNTSGLLLFTDDGDLAHRLMHPSHGFEREYAVRVHGEVGPEQLRRLCDGVMLDGRTARFEALREAGGEGTNHWYHVVLREGRQREVRRLWESQGVEVSRLTRVRFGPVNLPRWLRPGRWEDLRGDTLAQVVAGVAASPSATRRS